MKWFISNFIVLFICTNNTVLATNADAYHTYTSKTDEITTNSYNTDIINYCDFSTVYINDEVIHPPKCLSEVEFFLDKIKTTMMNTRGDSIDFKYGDNLQLKLKLPYLGKGRNGLVFTIIDDNKKTNKILKLNILNGNRGLISAKKETNNYTFWYESAKNNFFSVAKLYEFHSTGIYHIKEKNNGISLTEFLLDKKLIGVKNKEEPTNLTPLESKDKQVAKLNIAISSLLKIIHDNQDHNISISPHNIFIEFKDHKRKHIKKIELIEYGKSSSKKQLYQNIKNFNQYVQLIESSLNKYKKDGRM